jgi:hypothetical protein
VQLVNNALVTAQLGLADDGLRIASDFALDPAGVGVAIVQESGASLPSACAAGCLTACKGSLHITCCEGPRQHCLGGRRCRLGP